MTLNGWRVIAGLSVVAALAAVLFLAGACSPSGQQSTTAPSGTGTSLTGPSDTGSSTTGPSTSNSGSTASSGAASSSTSSVPGDTRVDLQVVTVVEGLRIPWEMRFLPDGRLLITEREGRIVVADPASGQVSGVGRIDVRAQGESGLMGLALDPAFPEPPYIYVSYTHDQGGDPQNRLSRFALSGFDGPALTLGSETILVDGIPAGSNHDGSRVAFGPDGYLWMTTGDSGDGGLAQRMDSLAGKVLRMTAEGQAPPDNPFVNEPYPFSLIYTLGHRNPQGLTFHPVSEGAFVTEHGPSDNDEINKLQAGGNYGWPDLRGKTGEPGFVDPLVTWTPTIAPAGALFYNGGRLGDLEGAFLFVTLKESDLRVLIPTDPTDFTAAAEERILFDEEFGRLRAIAVGPDGYLYISTSNFDGRGDPRSGDDRIIRIEPAG